MASSPQPGQPLPDNISPRTLGPYRLTRLLGEGATGIVYLAERTDFAQRVALKIYHPTFVTGALAAPDGEEQRILSLLDHPHIVRTIQQGAQPSGPRFLVMEYVGGEPIDTFADEQKLTQRARVELLLQALDALEHAHRHLVVHRDLKPAHLAVTPQGEVKLLDFGTAGAFAPSAFTPDYASPEQKSLLADAPAVSIASDLYSFGLIARLLLAGVPPAASPEARPSVLTGQLDPDAGRQLSAARSLSPEQWVGSLRGDLDAILLHALAPAPEARYLSAAHFAADLRAWTLGSPVLARPVSPAERSRRWMLQHRFVTAAAAVLVLAILLSAAGVLWQSARAIRQRRNAESRLRDLVRLTGTLDGELYSSIAAVPHSEQARAMLLSSVTDSLDRLSGTSGPHPVLSLELAGQYEQLASLQMARDPGAGGLRQEAKFQASRDIDQGLRLLQQVPAPGKNGPALEAERGRLLKLHAALQD